MSDSITIIERTIETAIATAIAVNIEVMKADNKALGSVLINGLFMGDARNDGTPGKRRDVNGPRINITCKPNIPKGYQRALAGQTTVFSGARTCMLTVQSVTQPDSDPDHTLALLAYSAFRKVFEKQEFTLPADMLDLRGYVITDGDAGITDDGFVMSIVVRLEVFYKAGV